MAAPLSVSGALGLVTILTVLRIKRSAIIKSDERFTPKTEDGKCFSNNSRAISLT